MMTTKVKKKIGKITLCWLRRRRRRGSKKGGGGGGEEEEEEGGGGGGGSAYMWVDGKRLLFFSAHSRFYNIEKASITFRTPY